MGEAKGIGAIRVRVLGIDPGLRLTGYACVEPAPRPRAGAHLALGIVEAGVLRLVRQDRETGSAASISVRLRELDDDVQTLMDRLRPTVVAVEGLFAHPSFPGSALTMAHARGVLLLAIARRGLPLVELKPTLVKKFISGSGKADKAQVQRAVQEAFGLEAAPKPADVADAIAIAACAAEHAGLRAGAGETVEAGLRRARGGRGRRTLPADVLAR